jgi:hypothetical protein
MQSAILPVFEGGRKGHNHNAAERVKAVTYQDRLVKEGNKKARASARAFLNNRS